MLKGSILISFILWLTRGLNSWYESSLLGRAMGALGRGLSWLLAGSFLGRLVEGDFSQGVFTRFLAYGTGEVKRGQVGLSNYLKTPLHQSVLGQYMAGYKDLKRGLVSFAVSLVAFGLVALRGSKKLGGLALGLGLVCLIGGLVLRFLPGSYLGRLLGWLRGLVYEEGGHDQDLQ